MPQTDGNLDLLSDPVAQELLQSRIPARLAYTWHDGTPRVVPIWFHWNGAEIVVGGPPDAPKAAAISANPAVAVTIDSDAWPYKVLMVRGTARVEQVDGVAAEYAAAAERYFGPDGGKQWVGMIGSMFDSMARVTIRPEHVTILDFETRFPSKVAARMGALQETAG